MLFNRSLLGWLLIFLLLTPVRLNSYLSDSKTNLPKYITPQLTSSTQLEISASSLMNILPFADQIKYFSKAYYNHIRHLHCIQLYLNSSTACTIATSVVHSKLDYCNSLYYRLPKSQLFCLRQIQNSLARTVVKASESCHITPILHSFHWLKITELIEYKLLSLTYKVLTIQPPYLHKLISVQRPCSTRSLLLLGHRHHPV